jgi:hypothetical protein
MGVRNTLARLRKQRRSLNAVPDLIRTLSARLITRYLPGPRALLIRVWAWLAAEMDDPLQKEHV